MNRGTISPNILHIVCHDLGRCCGVYGFPVSTPNLEHFAQGGLAMENMFCSSPACSPSRGCTMTGMYAHSNGLMGIVQTGPAGWHLPEHNTTLVDLFNQAGYETINIGGQHERMTTAAMRYQKVDITSHHCEDVFGTAATMLGQRKQGGQPFCMNLYTGEVHSSLWSRHGAESRSDFYRPEGPESAAVIPQLPDIPQVREEMACFNAAIRHLDAEFGKLDAALEGMGFKASTIIIFSTDHGAQGLRSKGTLYDAGTEITFLMQAPGMGRPGTRVPFLLQNIDLFPTLCDAVGLPVPSPVQGRSFWPLVTGHDFQPHKRIFTERNFHDRAGPSRYQPHYDPVRSVRTPQFHYIRSFADEPVHVWYPHEVLPLLAAGPEEVPFRMPAYRAGRPHEELFDIQADPLEKRNLAGDEAYRSILEDCRRWVHEWMVETRDPLLDGPVPDDFAPWPVPVDSYTYGTDREEAWKSNSTASLAKN